MNLLFCPLTPCRVDVSSLMTDHPYFGQTLVTD